VAVEPAQDAIQMDHDGVGHLDYSGPRFLDSSLACLATK
jgi:hypothetical protein